MMISIAIDCAELVRYLGAKDLKLIERYERSVNLTQNIGFTKEFLFLLKVSVILAGARYTYFRLRSSAEANVSSKRIDRLCQVLEVIRAYHVLTCLIQKSDYTPFEMLSGRCLRLWILEYVAVKPATDEFLKIYDVMTPELMILVQEAVRFSAGEAELCAVCDKRLEKVALQCEDGHFVVRCCITKAQVADLMPRMCRQCRKCVWHDLGELKKIVGDKEELLLCPLCDISFEPT